MEFVHVMYAQEQNLMHKDGCAFLLLLYTDLSLSRGNNNVFFDCI